MVGRIEALTGHLLDVRSFDLTDHDKTEHLFADERIDAVIHFAGLKAVGESVEKPLRVLRQQPRSHRLARCGRCVATGVRPARLLLLGDGLRRPERPCRCTRTCRTSVTNPYGCTKRDARSRSCATSCRGPDWRIALLRYFNPVGAHPSGRIGEDPTGIPNNLMPYLAQVAVGRREELRVFGADYDTPDGTGVRDYIHVDRPRRRADIAALARLDSTDAPVSTWNLGTGHGTLVSLAGRVRARVRPRSPGHQALGTASG